MGMPIFMAVLGAFIALSFIGMFVLWVLSIYHAVTSQTEEMKENRALWIALIVVSGLFGSIVYYLVDGQKKRAIIVITSFAVLVIALIVFAISIISIVSASGGIQSAGIVR